MAGLRIAIVLYEGMTALDAVGPQEVLRFLPGARVELVAEAAGPVPTDSAVQLVATTSYDACEQPDVVVVPGGPGTAGVSSGIDMALVLAERLSDATTAQAIQLVAEYDPQPPHDAGSLAKASPEVIARAVELGRPHGAIPDFWEAP